MKLLQYKRCEKAAELLEDESLSISDIVHEVGYANEKLTENVYKGSRDYLRDEKTPQESEAALDLVNRALSMPEGELLYVVSIGAITNIASAILMQPAIIEKIVVVWLGGHAHYWRNTKEFNMIQDIAAARVVFDSGVPLVQVPCLNVASHLSITEVELREYVKGKSCGVYRP